MKIDTDKVIKVLLLARVALECSEPTMKHYPEPVQRHKDAIDQVKALADELLKESQG